MRLDGAYLDIMTMSVSALIGQLLIHCDHLVQQWGTNFTKKQRSEDLDFLPNFFELAQAQIFLKDSGSSVVKRSVRAC